METFGEKIANMISGVVASLLRSLSGFLSLEQGYVTFGGTYWNSPIGNILLSACAARNALLNATSRGVTVMLSGPE